MAKEKFSEGFGTEFGATGKIGGVEKMKNRPSAFRMALAAIMATAVYLGAPCGMASAQNTSATTASIAKVPALAYGVGEVVKMYQGGINKDVIVDYINSTALPYRLNADGIIYLQTLGMPQEVTKAMILRDGQLQQRANQQQYYQQQPVPGAMPAPYEAVATQPPVQGVMPTTPAPAVTVIGSDYPVYDYGYPYYYGYGYPYYGWPLGYGWGWGWGHGGFRGGFGGFRGGGGFGGFRGGGGFHGGGHGGGHR